MRHIVLYHGNCLDGFASAVIAHKAMPEGTTFIACDYRDGHPVPRLDVPLDDDTTVLVLDVSITNGALWQLLESSPATVIWLDHHATSFESLGVKLNRCEVDLFGDDRLRVLLDNDKSGAVLTWNWFYGNDVPPVIQMVDAQDRGGTYQGWAPLGTAEVTKALWSYAPWDFETVTPMLLGDVKPLLDEGTALLRDHENRADKAMQDARNITVARIFNGMAVNCTPDLASTVGHLLAVESGTFGLTWHMDSRGRVCCSVRSYDGKTALDVAKSQGGGGHGNAAGFETNISDICRWMGGLGLTLNSI